MKKSVLLIILFFLSIYLVRAIPNPSVTYCENMGYTFNGTDCVFEDSSCELWAFYRGECGASYVKELPCSKAGESVSEGIVCCEGLSTLQTSAEGLGGICAMMVGGYGICSDCGDGTCETWENRCNCPSDCGESNVTIRQQMSANITQTSIVSGERLGNLTRSMEQIREQMRERRNYTFSPTRRINESECMQGCRCSGEIVSCQTQNGKTMDITVSSTRGYVYMHMEQSGANATSRMEIEIKTSDGNRTRMMIRMSNGQQAEVKIMPDEASEVALQRLRLRVCNADRNCSIELKEVGEREKQLAYELRAERQAKILGLFKKRMQVMSQVNAENGEIIRVQKPWWAFLATEPEE